MSGPRYAVIDVGTNTVRLLVAEQAEGRLVPVHTDKELLRLGRDLANNGRISDQSLLHVSDVLRSFSNVARKLGAVDLRIIATSAAREADNGQELATRVLADTGQAKGLAAAGERVGKREDRGVVDPLADLARVQLHEAGERRPCRKQLPREELSNPPRTPDERGPPAREITLPQVMDLAAAERLRCVIG